MKPSVATRPCDDERERRLVEAAGLDVDGATPYRMGHDLAVPLTSGVYVIADLRGPLYVGKTNNLRRRFGEHFDCSHNRLLRLALAGPAGQPTFACRITRPDDLTHTEIRYIRALHPLCNAHLFIHSNH